MRYIEKGCEPPAFTGWKTQGDANWAPVWRDFDGQPIKQVVKRALLADQGYLCCYCEIRTDEGSGHIEHVEPRSKRHDLELVYENLLYCCAETPKGRPTTCGHARKRDDPVPVSPLQPDCESRFLYTELGEMLPRKEHDFDARETVRILKLNEKLLRDARAGVYQEVVRARDELSPDEFRRWMGIELQRDANKMLNPFWGTKRYLAERILEA